MTEIEKMYENAIILCLHPSGFCKYIGATCEKCERHKYPPFTEHKQLELIKWLSHKYMLHINIIDIKEFGYCLALGKSMEIIYGGKTFADALANLINALWEKLSEEEQKQIKDILNG